MKLFGKIIFSLVVNFVALSAAVYFVPGFEISGNIENILVVTAIFTLINLFIKPILKLIAAPLIIITLGLASLIINAILLYALTYLDANVTISSTESLLYATLIISAVNIIVNFSAKSLYKND
ncbi:MAG: phage holin family protein [Candidatus Pacebacteria bacterium]|nr:phage holin family protein [Candidatus Paceibacterota bacterium]